MSDLEQAALVDDIVEELDKTEVSDVVEVSADSAPAADEKPEDGFQKRINKVTADKYAEKRRADELQRKIDELEQTPVKVKSEAPKLEDFDHDVDAHNAAMIDFKVEEAVSKQVANQRESASKATAQEAQSAFNERIVALGKDDFDQVANAIPTLPDGVAGALVNSENGAELIYHLGQHLDVADKLASMTPNQAMMELGRISATMSTKPNIKTSAAPDPIEPISSGGSLSNDGGPKGAKYE